MTVITYIGAATGLTLVRQLAAPDDLASLNIARTIVGGLLTTTGLLFVAQANAEIAGKIAALIAVTAALVHGGRIASIVTNYIGEPAP